MLADGLRTDPSSAARLLILMVFAAALGVIAFRFREPGAGAGSHWCPVMVGVDFIPNYIAGRALRAGLPIYDNHNTRGGDWADPAPDHPAIISRFVLPPPAAYLYAAVSGFPRSLAWKITLAGAVAAMTLAAALLSSLGGGDAWLCLLLSGALLVFYPLIFVLINGNVAIFCLPLLVAAIYFFVSGRSETPAALFFALAALVKLYPGLFLLYFAVQRRWSLLLKTYIFLLAAVALTARGGAYVTFLDRAQRYDHFVQAWYANASLFGVLMMGGVPLGASRLWAKIFAAVVIGFALIWVRRRSQDQLVTLYQCGLLSVAMILAPNTVYDYNLIFVVPALAAALWDLRLVPFQLTCPCGLRPAHVGMIRCTGLAGLVQQVGTALGTPSRRGPLVLMALSFFVFVVPTHFAMQVIHGRGVGPTTASLLADKFPWLLLFFAAVAWRCRQLQGPGRRGLPWMAAVVAGLMLAGCRGAARAPERCRNLIQNPNWENHAAGWSVPQFARLEEGPVRSFVIEGAAEGAIAQQIQRTPQLYRLGVIAVGYARVEPPHAMPATDEDVTAELWDGTVNLVNGFSRDGKRFEGPYARLRFTGGEVAAGDWKRLVTTAIPVVRARVLYPHFAFWGARLKPGVKLHVAALSLVEAPASDGGDPESWVACPNLPAPAPVLESVSRRQWEQDLEPDGAFEEAFRISERPVAGQRETVELELTARYRQGSQVADRFLVAVTEDGSDPRLSPTSRVIMVLARRGVEQWQAQVPVRADSRPVRIAVAAAALASSGLRTQTPLLPAAWQKISP